MGESARMRKVTFAIPVPLLEKLKALAYDKRIPSANAAVREALERYIVDLEHEDLRKAMESAAADPEFLRDIEDIESDFQHTDGETARMMREW